MAPRIALSLTVSLLSIGGSSAYAFRDIECKAKTDIMITKPGSYDRVVDLVDRGKVKAAQDLVYCTPKKGRGVFIVGEASRKRKQFVPVSTGDCIGETYRPHLMCPGDKPDKPAAAKKPATTKKRK